MWLLTRVIAHVSIDCQAGDVEGLNDVAVPLLSILNVVEHVIERLGWHVSAFHPALRTHTGVSGPHKVPRPSQETQGGTGKKGRRWTEKNSSSEASMG